MGNKIGGTRLSRSNSRTRTPSNTRRLSLDLSSNAVPQRSRFSFRRSSAPAACDHRMQAPDSPTSSNGSSPIALRWNRGARFSSTPTVHRGHYSFADDAVLERDAVQPEEEAAPLISGPLSLSVRLEYASLKRDQEHSVFGLVSLQAVQVHQLSAAGNGGSGNGQGGSAESQRSPVDVTCVLDVSGSMSGEKIQLVRDAVMFVIDEMMPGDRLSVVSFSHDAQRHTPLLRMDAEGKDAVRQAALRLVAGGGTSIAAGLDCAIANMEQRRQRNPLGALFLLTDGQDSSTRGQVQQLVDRARAAKCSLYAFGFGSDHDASLLSSFAEAAQTPFTYVEQVDTIKDAFAGAVSGLMSVAAQNIELSIVPESGCNIAAVHTHFSHTRASEGQPAAVVQIPDAFAGERRDVVVELRVSAAADRAGSAPLLRASAKYLSVRERAFAQTPVVVLEAERCEEPEGEPDAEVTAQRQRIEVTDALARAIEHGERGHFDEARNVLEQHSERLRKSCVQTEVSGALLEEVQDAQQRLSSASEWRNGGHAEVADAMWMHRNQRCTNLANNSKSRAAEDCSGGASARQSERRSKALYLTTCQRASINRSKMPCHGI